MSKGARILQVGHYHEKTHEKGQRLGLFEALPQKASTPTKPAFLPWLSLLEDETFSDLPIGRDIMGT